MRPRGVAKVHSFKSKGLESARAMRRVASPRALHRVRGRHYLISAATLSISSFGVA
jgi:hypothetical protein